jgi:hypothetical protein
MLIVAIVAGLAVAGLTVVSWLHLTARERFRAQGTQLLAAEDKLAQYARCVGKLGLWRALGSQHFYFGNVGGWDSSTIEGKEKGLVMMALCHLADVPLEEKQPEREGFGGVPKGAYYVHGANPFNNEGSCCAYALVGVGSPCGSYSCAKPGAGDPVLDAFKALADWKPLLEGPEPVFGKVTSL